MNQYSYTAVALAATALILAFILTTGSLNPFGPNENMRKQIARGQVLYGVRCANCHGKNSGRAAGLENAAAKRKDACATP